MGRPVHTPAPQLNLAVLPVRQAQALWWPPPPASEGPGLQLLLHGLDAAKLLPCPPVLGLQGNDLAEVGLGALRIALHTAQHAQHTSQHSTVDTKQAAQQQQQ